MTDWFAPSYWVGGNPFAAGDASMAANLLAGQANMGAVQQASNTAAAPTGYNPVYNSPVAFGDYSYGTVGGYPSFGEASGGGGGGGGTGTPSTAEQPFSPSGGGGGYYPASTATPYDNYGSSWDPVYGDGSGGGGPTSSYDPFSQYANGGYDPFTPFPGAAQQNVGDWGSRFASVQPQEPAYQPYTNPYTGYPFNEAYPMGGGWVPQGSPSYQWPPQGAGMATGIDPMTGETIFGGGSASAAASGQGDVYGGGAASAAAAYNPFNQYAHGGYDPFSPQTYQPAAQPNVGSWGGQTAAAPGGGGEAIGIDPMTGETIFADRFGGAPQPQLPNAITEGNYPRWDQRWDQIGDPYTNVPLNNALWQRGMDAGPQQPAGGGGGMAIGIDPMTGETIFGGGGGAQGGGSGYNPFQQYQSGGYDPFASSYENDLNQLLRGIDQGAGGGQQGYPSWLPPGDTLTPTDRGMATGIDPMTGETTYGGGASWRDAAAAAIMAQGGDGMADFQSPANNYNTFQQGSSTPSWQRAIPEGRSSPELINEINSMSQQYGWSPAAMAAVMQMESTFNPLQATGSYRGLTQMGPDTFKEAGGTLNGLTFEQYQRATPAQQARTYGAWIDHYAKTDPNNAASLVKGGIGSLPPEMQAAIMQATQFGPNSTDWVRALAEGNMSVPTTPYRQADALRPYTIEAMRDEFERRMQGW